MVSDLWNACSEGRLDDVHVLLVNATSNDMEVKDSIGSTPLIEAVRNGHVQVVSALLDKGADPNHASDNGPPSQHTSDHTVLALLAAAQNKQAPQPVYENGYDPNDEQNKAPYYSPYPYYPTLNVHPMSEGGVYYPPPLPQPSGDGMPGGPGNLPPAEIARFIPCRFFPACRYGASCMFLHPQPQGAYYQAPMPPPGQYPVQFDPNMVQQPYQPAYYPVPPPSFQQPNGVSVNSLPSPPLTHGRSPSMGPVPAPTHFSPNGHPPPTLPYGPMSPTAYPHTGQIPVPMSVPPLPPLQQVPPSPQSSYPPLPPAPQSYTLPPNGAYYPPQPPIPVNYLEMNGSAKPPTQSDQFSPNANSGLRENGHQRRPSARRGSFVSRKPPCLFFPSGRCKNGDDCRFPHVLPEGSAQPGHGGPASGPYFNGSRGGGPRSRGGHGVNGFATIDEKLAAMTIRDDQGPRYQNGDASSRSHSSEASRSKYGPGFKNGVNGPQNKRLPQAIKQRVPNADEFPVLPGMITPPQRNSTNGPVSPPNGSAAPTAAQVLQAAPRPTRQDAKSDSDSPRSAKDIAMPDHSSETPQAPPPLPLPTRLPISFAAVATAAPEVMKEVHVSA